jgi:hypothetical protein
MSWRRPNFVVEKWDDPPIIRVIDALQKTHERVICRSFRRLTDLDKPFKSWEASTLSAFLSEQSIRSALSEMRLPEAVEPFPPITLLGTYEFEGAVTALLLTHGPYADSELTEEQARQMARAFVDAICGDRRGCGPIFRIDSPLSDWFYNVAWDASFALQDSRDLWWVIFVTDSD